MRIFENELSKANFRKRNFEEFFVNVESEKSREQFKKAMI